MREDMLWLLERIKSCNKRWGRSTKKYIFQGSYDVCETSADQVYFNDIMNHRINETRDLGLMILDVKNGHGRTIGY